ncbi:hypothetical protein M3231_14025 [Neobacillus mesonae]|nr:hypothetical protein [Neobacillus mesonae]
MLWYMLFGIGAICIIITLGIKLKQRREKSSRSNVIYLKDVRMQTKLQKCYKCKKAKKLRFYSDPSGKVTGICKECETQAGGQKMLPL